MSASARIYHPGSLTLMGFLLSLLVYVVLLRRVGVVPLAGRRPLAGLRPTAQTLFSGHHESRAPTHTPPHSVPGMSTNNQSSGAFVLDVIACHMIVGMHSTNQRS